MVASGRSVLLALFGALVVVSLAGYVVLRQQGKVRFAVGVYSVPDSGSSKLLVDRPVLVRIEKATAGRSSMKAVALLLSQNGKLLMPIQQLAVGRDAAGRPTEQVQFPPLGQMPDKGLLAVAVIRLPSADPPSVARLQQAIGDGGPIHLVFGSLASASRSLGGHAEVTMVEVKAAGSPSGSSG